ncbi:hypothetical protein KZ829_13270 [Actinoplanes hulinensis]|uniref:Uncharacterized protein n=1 Tax=Actinoplanes hulinensis TaxID=1144547 RepID=A0ABS7B1A9_9ACTN|nr:hypothetical protein [Actinoplanes hulinensis]MBW6434707.1 hypothetical protein [Actinoplanes hulinensis]
MRAVIASLDITCVSANSASVGRLARIPLATRGRTTESPAPVRCAADPLNADVSTGTPLSTTVLAAAPPDTEPPDTEPLATALPGIAPLSAELLAATPPDTEPLATALPDIALSSTEPLVVTPLNTELLAAEPSDTEILATELLAAEPPDTELVATGLLTAEPPDDGLSGVAPLAAAPLNAERVDGESTMIGWINVASVNVDGLGIEMINVGGVEERLDIELVAVDPRPTGSGVDAAGYPCGSSDADPRGVTAIEHLLPGRGAAG